MTDPAVSSLPSTYCPHGIQRMYICPHCQEQARRERMEQRFIEAVERFTAVVEQIAPPQEERCEACESNDIHFDRSICACGAMHYYCSEGHQVDSCEANS